MSRKQLLTASFDWVDLEVDSSTQHSTQPHPVQQPTDDNSLEWKASPAKAREEFLPERSYDSHALTPTEEWWERSDDVGLQQF